MNSRLPFRAAAASLLCLSAGSFGASVMYRAFVRANLRRALRDLSRGRHEVLLRTCSPSIEHTFPGSHPLGGTRHSSDAVRRWFERLYRLFPQLSFEVHDVVVRGWPWD